jgi:hypothetical protein
MQVATDARRLFDRARQFPRENCGGYKVGFQDDREQVLVLGELEGYGQVREFMFGMASLGYQPLILGEPEQMQHCDFVFARPGPQTLDTLVCDWSETEAGLVG